MNSGPHGGATDKGIEGARIHGGRHREARRLWTSRAPRRRRQSMTPKFSVTVRPDTGTARAELNADW